MMTLVPNFHSINGHKVGENEKIVNRRSNPKMQEPFYFVLDFVLNSLVILSARTIYNKLGLL